MADSNLRKFDTITNGLDGLSDYLKSLDKANHQAHFVLYQLGSQKILLKIDLEQKAVIYDDFHGRKINVFMEEEIKRNLPGIRIIDARKAERNIHTFSEHQSIDLHDINWVEHTAEKLDDLKLTDVDVADLDIAKEFANRKTPLGLYDKKPSAPPLEPLEKSNTMNFKK